MTPFRTIDHDEARSLIETGAVTMLDIRTPAEYEQLGHIPGAWLLPVDLVASAPAVLPDDGKAAAGLLRARRRSVAASRLLSTAGTTGAEPFRRAVPLEWSARIWRGEGARPIELAARKCRSVAQGRQACSTWRAAAAVTHC